MRLNIQHFPDYFEQYTWNNKHKLYGYPKDSYPDFCWIKSLENRFDWLRNNCTHEGTSSKYLIREMINWGGSQNGVLQKFDDRSGEINLYDQLKNIIDGLNDPERAISQALELPGLGLTYTSKLLRFLNPDMYAALDSRIRSRLVEEKMMVKINDGNNNSMVKGYLNFLEVLDEIKNSLNEAEIQRPVYNFSESRVWRPADIEMGLFSWADLR